MPKGIRCQIGGPLKAIVLMSYFMTDLEARILKSSEVLFKGTYYLFETIHS